LPQYYPVDLRQLHPNRKDFLHLLWLKRIYHWVAKHCRLDYRRHPCRHWIQDDFRIHKVNLQCFSVFSWTDNNLPHLCNGHGHIAIKVALLDLRPWRECWILLGLEFLRPYSVFGQCRPLYNIITQESGRQPFQGVHHCLCLWHPLRSRPHDFRSLPSIQGHQLLDNRQALGHDHPLHLGDCSPVQLPWTGHLARTPETKRTIWCKFEC